MYIKLHERFVYYLHSYVWDLTYVKGTSIVSPTTWKLLTLYSKTRISASNLFNFSRNGWRFYNSWHRSSNIDNIGSIYFLH